MGNRKIQNVPINNCKDLIFNTNELIPFDYNERCQTEAYPSMSMDGLELFYTHNQSYDWIFYSWRSNPNNQWSVPVPITITQFKQSILSSCLSHDKKTLYFTSGDKFYKCNRTEDFSSVFGIPEEIQITGVGADELVLQSNLSFNLDESILYAFVKPTQRMAQFKRENDRTYIFEKYVSQSNGEMGVLSNNGKLYLFSNSNFPYLLFCKKRASLDVDFSPEVYVVKQFEQQLTVGQVRISESTNKMVMVLSDYAWNRNDLYFCDFVLNDSIINRFKIFDEQQFKKDYNPSIQSVLYVTDVQKVNPVKTKSLIDEKGSEAYKIEIGQTFPNPCYGTFYFYYSVSTQNDLGDELPIVKVMDNNGRVVYQANLEQYKGEGKVILENGKTGDYRLQIIYAGISSEIVKIHLSR
jgi:hypothetical protein